ncbi:hypothetical protein B0H13DRAFT_2001093, partial [Mycena leptocephala]
MLFACEDAGDSGAALRWSARTVFMCCAWAVCAPFHPLHWLAQYRSRKQERGGGDILVGYTMPFFSLVLVTCAASA